MRGIFVLAFLTGFLVGCSQKSAPQSGTEQQPAATSPARDGQAGPTGSTPAASTAPAAAEAPLTEPPPTTPARPGAARARRPASHASAPQRSAAEAAASDNPTSASAPDPAPPAAEFREVTIPAGTSLSVKLLSTLASDTSKVEDPVRGSLAKPIVISGVTAVPAGTELSGSVIDAKESGRIKGRASIAFRFERLVAHGETYRLQTARVTREAETNRGDDVKKGGIGGGLGAIVGGVVGGGKGAAIGAVAGGTGAVLATKGREVALAPGTVVSVVLQEPVTLSVPINRN